MLNFELELTDRLIYILYIFLKAILKFNISHTIAFNKAIV